MKRLKRLLSKKNKSGFTLVEVIISTALLGILILGMTMFMSPLFGIIQDSTADVRANNLGTSINYYLSRSMRNASFIAVFTNAKYGDFTSDNGSNPVKTIKEMGTYVTGHANYQMKCISIRKVQDYKNSGTSKYMLFNEKVDASGMLDSTDNPTGSKADRLVFEKCYYDGLFPMMEFSQPKLKKLKEDGSGDYEETTDLAPSIQIKVTIRDKDGTDANDVIFIGEGYSELRNIKTSQDDASLNLGYKIYSPVPTIINTSPAPTDTTDTFIFYVERELK